jgi:hypothetical protein
MYLFTFTVVGKGYAKFAAETDAYQVLWDPTYALQSPQPHSLHSVP